MPVLSVRQARDLEATGTIAGRVIAVAGYYGFEVEHCYSGAIGDELEPGCGILALFADTKAAANPRSGGSNPPANYIPVFLATNGVSFIYAGLREPVQIVVLGHIGDPRYWKCGHDFEACQGRFVADRVVWADGQFVPQASSPVTDANEQQLWPRMSVDDVASAVASSAVVSLTPVQARHVIDIDPRWPMTGDQLVWVVRYLSDSTETGDSRTTEVALVDDSTGAVIGTKPLAMGSDYMPPRLWLDATRTDFDAQGNISDSLAPVISVVSAAGEEQYRGPDWSASDQGISRTGQFLPGLFEPGTYRIDAWLQSLQPGKSQQPIRQCSTSIALNAQDNVGLAAAFTGAGPCTWAPTPPFWSATP